MISDLWITSNLKGNTSDCNILDSEWLMKDGRIEGKPHKCSYLFQSKWLDARGHHEFSIIYIVLNLSNEKLCFNNNMESFFFGKPGENFVTNLPKDFKQKPEKWPQTWKKCGERLKDSEEFFNSQSWLENLRETSLRSFMVRFGGDDVRSPTITCMKSKQFPVPGSVISSHLAQRRRKLPLPRC